MGRDDGSDDGKDSGDESRATCALIDGDGEAVEEGTGGDADGAVEKAAAEAFHPDHTVALGDGDGDEAGVMP